MANHQAAGMRSLGMEMEVQGSNNDKINAAWEDVDGLKLKQIDKPRVCNGPPGNVELGDLPLVPMNAQAQSCMVMVDVIRDCEVQFDFNVVKALMKDNLYDQLIEPLSPKNNFDVPFVMQLVIVPTEPGKSLILKQYVFQKTQRPSAVMSPMIRGDAFSLVYGRDRYRSNRVWQKLMEGIGGMQFLYFNWPTDVKAGTSRLKSKEEIEAGFLFIKEDAPRTNFDNEQMMWVQIQLNDAESPIFGWKDGVINAALSTYKTSANLAHKQTYYPLAWGDVSPQMQSIMADIIPVLLTSTILLVGMPGWAKTPLNIIMAMALGRYHADRNGRKIEPGYRLANDLDFFRGEAGSPEVPCIFDDGDLFDSRPKTLKAFFDPTLEESLTRERWGATKFVMGQARMAAENEFDAAAEPSDVDWLWLTTSTTEKRRTESNKFFIDMLRPAFPRGIGKSNIDALTKRITVILNTERYIYVRKAGLTQHVVRHQNEGHYITEAAGKILHEYKRNKMQRDPAVMEGLVATERQFFTAKLEQIDRVDLPSPPAVVPSLKRMEISDGPAERIERKFSFGKRFAPHAGPIDLDSPSPVRPRRVPPLLPAPVPPAFSSSASSSRAMRQQLNDIDASAADDLEMPDEEDQMLIDKINNNATDEPEP